jgi:hypothetical protein
MMASLSWWRSWHGAPTDHKWSVIASRSGVKVGIVSAIAWALLDYASQQKERGSVDGFDVETYSVYSGFSEQEINAVITAMHDKGVIVSGFFAKWEERQPKREDYSTPRVNKSRELKRNVTQCNAPDKDTDKDKEGEEERETPPSTPLNFRALSENTVAEKVYLGVTGMGSLPGPMIDKSYELWKFAMDRGGIEQAVLYLKPFYDDWAGRKTKGGQPYSKTGNGWLDWAIAGKAPKNGTEPKPLTGRESRRAMLKY